MKKLIISLFIILCIVASINIAESAKVSGISVWVDGETPTAAKWNANDAAFTTAIDNVESVQIVDGTIVNADIANSTINLATKASSLYLTSFYIDLPDGTVSTPTFALANSLGTGFYRVGADNLGITVAKSLKMDWAAGQTNIYSHLIPNGAGTYDLGGATNYWNDVNYKTLTDRGCLGWFDNGVEMPNGEIVSDVEAIKRIQKHPTKKTIYGAPMLDYKTFPKVSYKKADDKDGVLLPRDENDEPIGGADGIEMTSMFSIMFGAVKELSNENQILKTRIDDLEKRLEKLENK